ncbi:hypothetical protein J4466_05795 [Candidatus Pacearchaeota archaeon]|nr:hypothetical protein [Candidatus Pacearchaeota archaeon]
MNSQKEGLIHLIFEFKALERIKGVKDVGYQELVQREAQEFAERDGSRYILEEHIVRAKKYIKENHLYPYNKESKN